jgi:hypothetical protein
MSDSCTSVLDHSYIQRETRFPYIGARKAVERTGAVGFLELLSAGLDLDKNDLCGIRALEEAADP